MYQKRFDVAIDRSKTSNFPAQNSIFSGKNRKNLGKKGVLHSKKAQVTLFIILGLLFLLALVLVIVFRKEVITIKPEELLPTKKGKIETFISNCLADAGQKALIRAGLQGGYVVVPLDIANDGSRHLKTSPFTVIPYWAYGPSISIPPLDEIKAQIDDYVEQNVRPCLLDTESFQQEFTLVEKSAIEADTQITNAKVLFNVHWDIEIRDQAGEIITELIDHTADSPIKLKRVYETAKRIVEMEMQTLKLEDITQDLIALEHPDVPLAGLEVSCSKKKWEVAKVKATLQDLLRVNLRQLRVSGTDIIQFPDQFPYYQNHYIWNMGEDFNKPDVSVVFNYDNSYPFTFHVTPAEGQTMKSGMLGGTDLISFLCLQNWKFTYDVSYPVQVRVRDETTGYVFNIAFTVHLMRNLPNRNVPITARPSTTLDFADGETYCSLKRIPLTVRTWELVENPAQGIYNAEPLDGVNVSITCIKYRCEMGTTKFNFAQQGYQSSLSLNFPHCIGGILRGQKGGYKETWTRVVTDAGAEADLYLAPLYVFPGTKVKVVKHEPMVPSTALPQLAPGKEISDTETALIQLTLRKPTDLPEQPFHQSSMMYSKDLDTKIAEQQKLELLAEADYTYELQIDVFDNQGLSGGYRINWTLPWDQLVSAKELIFHVVGKDNPDEEEQFALFAGLEEQSKFIPQPELKP